MTRVLIGHRGVGKSATLKRLRKLFKNTEINFFDLDREIEIESKKTISKIFSEDGETAFRQLEKKVFNRLHQESGDKIIAVGAGFIPPREPSIAVVWLRRESDPQGRIFIDRPRLLPHHSPYAESLAIYQKRTPEYQERADEVFILPEGEADDVPGEALFWEQQLQPGLRGHLTLLPWHFKTNSGFDSFINRRTQWGNVSFEIRTDILSQTQIDKALNAIPKNRILYSWRMPGFSGAQEGLWDWALELGPPPIDAAPSIISLHDREADLQSCLTALEKSKTKPFQHLKLAVPIFNFAELKEGHGWWQEDPEHRSFLPVSKSGRWNWYRQIFIKKSKLAFFREDNGSAPDQPTFSQWIHAQGSFSGFAAVLGFPVSHSFTPTFHREFFSKLGWLGVAIPMEPDEFTAENLEFLKKLGLKAAAVTSPLKQLAFELSEPATEKVKNLESANTLWFDGNKWLCDNTDLPAFETWIRELAPPSPIVLWGGGGTRKMVGQAFKEQVHQYSARLAAPKKNSSPCEDPQTVIWAVGRSRQDACRWPPKTWKPRLIVDLNYSENSPGREYSLNIGAKYVSGLRFFELQALEQQRRWKSTI